MKRTASKPAAGFTTAANVLKSSKSSQDTAIDNPPPTTQPAFTQPTQNAGSAPRTFSFSLSAVGLKHHTADRAAAIEDGTSVTLLRDPTNAVDAKAIRVCVDRDVAAAAGLAPLAHHASSHFDEGDGAPPSPEDDAPLPPSPENNASPSPPSVSVAHLSWQQAAALAPALDTGLAAVTSAIVDGRRDNFELLLNVVISARGAAADLLDAADTLHGRHTINVLDNEVSLKIADDDVKAAESNVRHVEWPPSATRRWEPLPQWNVQNKQTPAAAAAAAAASSGMPPPPSRFLSGYQLPWEPYDPTAISQPSIDEVAAAQEEGWPPPSNLLAKLGLAPADDAQWWRKHGLLPPTEWSLSGAFDMLPTANQGQENKKKASALLDGGCHGCVPWDPTLLDQLDETMRTPNFWCRRKSDAFIRAFGGPYVLGQDEEKLKLIHGADHTELTSIVCTGHSMVYTAVHLCHPQPPGFNTLIFGLNLRSSGFYYHQDAETAGLKPKNAPLVPCQPVVTTVLYAQPTIDQEKEVVLWRPRLNWEPREGPFTAVRALTTPHGMVHIQRAGLQKGTKHGVFHAPRRPKRQSFRVALTARITHVNAPAIVANHVAQGEYSGQFGPEGKWTLPRVEEGPGEEE